jgi:hypothetical protein
VTIVIVALSILVEHDLFGKPVSTFPDHAQSSAKEKGRQLPALKVIGD